MTPNMRVLRCLLLLVVLVFGLTSRSHAAEELAGVVVFVSGNATLSDGQSLKTGQSIRAGNTLVTGADGYVYLKTVDGGFLILRSATHATVVRYLVDTRQPKRTRIKLELTQGTARVISGDAVKQSPRAFRLNTPVAAIGVRGTDFTVVTTADRTQVEVQSGGVVMSGFSASCAPAGDGPCNDEAVELFAGKSQRYLFLERNQLRPRLLDAPEMTPQGGARSDEPAEPVKSGGLGNGKTDLTPLKQSILPASPVAAEPSAIVWGRWRPALDQPISFDLDGLRDSHAVVAVGQWHILLRERQMDEWQVPRHGTLGFVLRRAEAVIFNERSQQLVPGSVSGGRLTIDFARARFDTSLTLLAGQEQWALRTQGAVLPNGRLSGNYPISSTSNMSAHGALDQNYAAYLFQSRLDEHRVASGATTWFKP